MALVRLQKHLARAGVASRRAAETLILAGRVKVNGRVIRELGTRVDPDTDRVRVDDREIKLEPARWIALHKPRGFVSTRRDPGRRRTVFDLLPPEHRRLFTVGRLDADSEGLLLFTNDGDAAHRLLHPRYGVRRVYVADVTGRMTPETVARFVSGVALEDGPARAVGARLVSATPESSRVQVTMVEGRKREVRRMLEAVGHNVSRLRRVAYGPIRLGRLAPGQWRPLTAEEVAAIGSAGGPRRRSPRRGGRGRDQG